MDDEAAASGPRPMSHTDRMALAREIAERATQVYGAHVLAIGLYGSLARGEDGPYSDIEIFCVLRDEGRERTHEWCAGPWKAEVNVVGAEALLREAAALEGHWPLTHGAFLRTLPLHDPEAFFPRLRAAATSADAATFHATIEEVLVGDIYELVGKLRNAQAAGHASVLPILAVEMARYAAFALGLHHRSTYTSGAGVLEEALLLADRPEGFDALSRQVLAGSLADPALVAAACEGLWAGLVQWAARHGYRIVGPTRIPF